MSSKKMLFVILLFANFFITKAQTITWYQEDFSKETWYSNKDGKIKYYYENQKYVIENRNTSSGQYSWITENVYLDDKKDFFIEADFSFEDCYDDKYGASLVFSLSNKKIFFVTISPKQGKFSLSSYLKEEGTKDLIAFKEEPAIKKGLNITNKITIGVKNKEFFININNVQVHKEAQNPTYQNIIGTFGFATSTNSKIFIDNLILKQDNKISILTGMETSKLVKENLGTNINTEYPEKIPFISPDGLTLYYSIEGHPENTGGTKDNDEIWYSESKDGGETWQPKKRIGVPLNNDGNNAVISSTPDNNTLLLMHKYKSDGSAGGSGFSITHRTADGWEVPQDIEMEDYVSTTSNSFCLSVDRKFLLMSVTRPENIGKQDLWVSMHIKENRWSKPINLGKNINTTGSEMTPFLAADGVNLYFASDGFAGYGSADIFVTQRLDDSWTKWSEPKNLGSGINGKGWDAYYRIPASGKYAYMTNNEKGSLDIIRIKLPQAAKPKPVILVSGKVYNAKTKQPLSANISYNDLKNQKELGLAVSNPKDGSYKIVLPAGNNYGFLASKEQFFAVSENVDASKITEYKEIVRDLYLAPIEVGQVIRLNNIFFDSGLFKLRNESFGDLERLVKIMNENMNLKILISGHTDNVGIQTNNLPLSQNRAKAVKDYLISKGIEASRLNSEGLGDSKPTDTNATEIGKQRNRRVEFTIQSK
ncbi:MAG: hypothetical protein EAZ85_14105 [Bacteroidetes bacterium]|nr:MAG: hypothetical protein EAZ85_14105 [Bacteroidota bacterium]TAG86049.1 MAG: hypothetical protein EAZ20_13585 [Bacteroidota bacterium]